MWLGLAKVRGAGTLSALAWLALSSCAHQLGAGAASKAARKLEKGQEQSAGDPSTQSARVAADQAVTNAIAALHGPVEREKLQQALNELVSREVASALQTSTEVPPGEHTAGGRPAVSPVALAIGQAMRSGIEAAVQQIILDIGGRGHGPLTPSIRGTAKQVSVAVAGSARKSLIDLFPSCHGPDAIACINRQLKDASESAKAGFSKAILESLGWQLLVAAALIGLAVGIIGPSLWSLRTRRRRKGHFLRPGADGGSIA